MREFTKDQITEILDLYQKGSNTRSLGSLFKTSKTTISTILKNNGVQPRLRHNKSTAKIQFSESEVINIIKEYSEYRSAAVIAKKHNCSGSVIEKLLHKNGIKLYSGYNFSDDVVNEMVKLYSDGFSVYYIADKFSVSRAAITPILRKSGISLHGSRVYSVNENYFSKIDTPEKAYWLGFIYADGSVFSKSSRGHRLSIKLSYVDTEHLEKLKKTLNYTGPLFNWEQVCFGKLREFYELNVSSKIMVNDLISHGVVPNKTFKVSIPELDNFLMRDFIRGLVDGDGSIGFYSRGCSFNLSSGVYDFLYDVKTIINKALNTDHGSLIRRPNTNTCALSYGGNNSAYNVIRWLYDDAEVYLDRKHQKYLEIKDKILSSKF